MGKEILIQIQEGERKVAILKNGHLDDFLIESDRRESILGNIYKGKVESILPSINGAFVNIGLERNGFLYLTDTVNPELEKETAPQNFIQKIFHKKEERKKGGGRHHRHETPNLKTGQEILVQVVKEPFDNKGARLTTHVSLAGRFIVYMPYDKQGGISRRIENVEERQRLRDVLKSFNFIKNGGFIVRTASSQQNRGDLLRDARFLVKIWRQILDLAGRKSAPNLIYKEYDLLWKIVRDFLTEDVDHLIIDSPEECDKMRKFVQNLIGRRMVNKIELYRGTVPLFESKNVSKELEKIYDTRIYLKSGAHIVIERTEGITVVDVNSGKFKTRASPEDAAFMVNMEAAPEIARQLRLRDLGGIIVIDFIDMQREDHKRKVLEALQDALTHDTAKTEVNRISSLGLVEMTRARTGINVESISFHTCPYCDGRGKVKTI